MADDRARGASAPDTNGRFLRVLVYSMLVLSAGATVLFRDTLWAAYRDGYLPIWAPLVAPWTFTAFVLVYAADRYRLVRRRHYPVSRALFQVAFALVFLTLLLPQHANEARHARREDDQVQAPALLLLQHAEVAVRAAACEVMAGRFPPSVVERVAHLAHNDAALPVRVACGAALDRIHPPDAAERP
jgi:hypothetical protein